MVEAALPVFAPLFMGQCKGVLLWVVHAPVVGVGFPLWSTGHCNRLLVPVVHAPVVVAVFPLWSTHVVLKQASLSAASEQSPETKIVTQVEQSFSTKKQLVRSCSVLAGRILDSSDGSWVASSNSEANAVVLEYFGYQPKQTVGAQPLV